MFKLYRAAESSTRTLVSRSFVAASSFFRRALDFPGHQIGPSPSRKSVPTGLFGYDVLISSGLPGGGMIRRVPPAGGGSSMPGSMPAGGHTMPPDLESWRLPLPLDPVVSPPTDGAVRSSIPGGQSSRSDPGDGVAASGRGTTGDCGFVRRRARPRPKRTGRANHLNRPRRHA